MKGLPRITEIIKVEPFMVTVRWTTGEIRVIDLGELLTSWSVAKNDNTDMAGLWDYETFRYVSIAESKTLQWAIVLVPHLSFDENNVRREVSSPLMLDPDMLYEFSRSIEEYRLVPVDRLANAA